MDIRIGSPATGDNFYKRPVLLAKLRRALRRDNVAFLGPRRTGKTSCLEAIRVESTEYLPILLNLEKHDTVEAWLSAMLEELRSVLEQPEGWASRVRGILKATCRVTNGLSREQFEAIHSQLDPELSQLAAGIEELDHVLDTLKHDGYLLQDTSRLTRFSSNILQDFWMRKIS